MSCMLHSATTSSAMVPTFSIKTPHAPPATIQSLQPSVVKLPMTQLVPPKKAEEALMNYRSRPGVRRPEVRKHSLAHVWRKIQGCDDWKELIDPLHPLLRAEVVRYGELVNACYKAFDLDRSSDRYLNCKYGKARMMTEVGMDGCGYQVTKYVYATADVAIPMQEASATCSSRWIGYVAVASDEQVARIGRRDVMVAFRGTVTSAEWAANFMSSLTPANLDPQDPRPDVMVETGFLSLYTSDDRRSSKFSQGSLREQLLGEASRLFSEYKDEEVSITLVGHSMGSALAQLLAYDLAELGLTTFRLQREIMITVYSFGGPRVGNPGFKQRCEELGLKVLRVANAKDPVTNLPGVFLNESFSSMAERYKLPWSWSCYTHVGVELPLDFFSMENPASAHDLGEYINLLKWCPTMAYRKDDGAMNLLGGARKLLRKQKIGTWSLQDTARQMGDLVQFLGLI